MKNLGVLRVESSGRIVARNARLATGFWDQLVGWIGIAEPPSSAAIGLVGCSRIHTVGVRFPVDVAYCDSEGDVLRVVTGILPCSIPPGAAGARIAWEAPAGPIAAMVREGDRLVWTSRETVDTEPESDE